MLFRCCSPPISGDEDISPLFTLSDEDRIKATSLVDQVLEFINPLKSKKSSELLISKLNLKFGLDEVCPVNELVSDKIEITNSSPSNIEFSIEKAINFPKSHQITLTPSTKSIKLARGESVSFRIDLIVRFSSTKRIQNAITLEAYGFHSIIGIDLTPALSDIYSYDEIHNIISKGTLLAKSNCPVYKVNWRGIDISVKCLMDLVTAPDEVKLHKCAILFFCCSELLF